MKCKWYEFHKWESIYEEVINEYLDEVYISYTTNLKVCQKCGIIKEYSYDSQGGSWSPLCEQKMKIINNKMVLVGDKLVIKKKMHEK